MRMLHHSKTLRLAAAALCLAQSGASLKILAVEKSADSTASRAEVEAGERGHPERRLMANFRFAPWPNVLKWYADELDLVLDLDEVPPGTFNYYDDAELNATELLDVFNGYLLPKGFLLLQRDRFLVCVNVSQGVPPNLVPHVPLEELPQRGRNELLSVVIPVHSGSATETAKQFEALLGPQGRIAAIEADQSLAVIDIGTNLRRIAAIVGDGHGRQLRFRAFSLQHIAAAEAERTVLALLGLAPDAAEHSLPRLGNVAAALARGAAKENDHATQLSVDARNNRLFVVSGSAELRVVEQILESIDVAPAAYSSSSAAASGLQIVGPGRQEEMAVLAALLTRLSPRIRVTTSGGDSGSAAPKFPGPEKPPRATLNRASRQPAVPPAETSAQPAASGSPGDAGRR